MGAIFFPARHFALGWKLVTQTAPLHRRGVPCWTREGGRVDLHPHLPIHRILAGVGKHVASVPQPTSSSPQYMRRVDGGWTCHSNPGLDVHHGGDLEKKSASVAGFVASVDR